MAKISIRPKATACMANALFWATSALVATAFLLALAGEEFASPAIRISCLSWHESAGLLSLFTLVGMLLLRCLGYHPITPLPRWHPLARRALAVTLYVLLLVQPISGWLLASHTGTQASFVGVTLPPLADRDGALAGFGAAWHGPGGAAILILAMVALRLHLTAFVARLVRATTGRGVKRREVRNGRGA